MANSTSINKSRIFKLAWKLFRRVHARYGAWQITRGIVDGSFSHALRAAWAEEKRLVRAAQGRAAHSKQIRVLEARKEALSYKPIGHRISAERASLDRQINQLIAA